jgi:hypothetical protein
VAKLAGVSRVRIDKGIAELTGEKVVKEDSPSQKICQEVEQELLSAVNLRDLSIRGK